MAVLCKTFLKKHYNVFKTCQGVVNYVVATNTMIEKGNKNINVM